MTLADGKEALDLFLYMPNYDAKYVFSVFSTFPNAVISKGENPLERFVYVPGNRKDRVLLIAHSDTIWDEKYTGGIDGKPIFEDGIYRSNNPDCGIGADDRAGCAMLWALKDSGHSLLILDGEEHGKIGAKYLKKQYPELFKEINRHQFMIEFDWRGTGGCLYNQVDYTDKFLKYITDNLGFVKEDKKGGCDLQILCKDVCGVNVGVGYYNQHKSTETLVLDDWMNTYNSVSALLEKTQPRFPISKIRRISSTLKRIENKIKKLLK